MKRYVISLLFVVLIAGGLSCSSGFTQYRTDMFHGKNALEAGDYREAQGMFLKAADEQPTPAALAYGAVASYKAGDIPSADRLIRNARAVADDSLYYSRILGYDALILLREGRTKEGLAALREYTEVYKKLEPLTSIRYVETMWRTGKVDLPLLERLIDEQVARYEDDMKQASQTGTGFIANKWETRILGPIAP